MNYKKELLWSLWVGLLTRRKFMHRATDPTHSQKPEIPARPRTLPSLFPRGPCAQFGGPRFMLFGHMDPLEYCKKP